MSTIQNDQNITSTPSYTYNPRNLPEAEGNVMFQFGNVHGFMDVKDYECALIKAKFLVADLEILLKLKWKIEDVNDIWRKSLWDTKKNSAADGS